MENISEWSCLAPNGMLFVLLGMIFAVNNIIVISSRHEREREVIKGLEHEIKIKELRKVLNEDEKKEGPM